MKLKTKPGGTPLLVAASTCLLVWLCIMGIRSTGGLELLELAAYDYFTSSMTKGSSVEPRVIMVKITEDDIRREGRWPHRC